MHLLKYFDKLSLKPENAKELKGLILDLAIRGRLTEEWRVENNTIDGRLSLLEKVSKEKKELYSSNKAKIIQDVKVYADNDAPFKIDNSWLWLKFLDIAYIVRGGSPRPIKSYITDNPNGINWIKIGDTKAQPKYIFETRQKIIQEGIKRSRRVVSGDFLLSNSMSFGRPYILRTTGCIHDGWLLIRKSKKIINEDYLYHLLSSKFVYNSFKSRAAGGVVQNLNIGKVKEVMLPLPPLAEQKAIVKIVNQLMAEVDQLEAQTKTRVQLRQDYIQSALRQLTTADPQSAWNKLKPQFTSFFDTAESIDKLKEAILQLAVQGKLTKQWRAEHPNVEPASVLLEKIKEEKAQLIKEKKIKKEKPLPEITKEEIPFELPEDWIWSRFQEVASIASNLVDPSLYQQMPHIAPNVIEKNSGRLLSYKSIKEDKVISAKNLFRRGQIVYSKIRPNLNKLVMVDFEGLCSADMYPIDCYIYTEYLFNFMLSIVFLKQSVKTDTRVAMPKINQTELNKILVPVAPISEQKVIVQIINQLKASCDQIKSEIQNRNTLSKDFLKSSIREVMEQTGSLS